MAEQRSQIMGLRAKFSSAEYRRRQVTILGFVDYPWFARNGSNPIPDRATAAAQYEEGG